MYRKTYILIIFVFLILAGCAADTSENTVPPNEQSPSVESIKPIETEDIFDYSQYIGKTWVEKNGDKTAFSFSVRDIKGGILAGKYSSYNFATPSPYDISNLSGTVAGDKAELQFSDSAGNKGTIKLLFKQNNEIEATITYTEKSRYENNEDGTFLFKPYNIVDLENYSIIEEHSFMVDLNLWGNVKFVPAKILGSIHKPPLEFILTDSEGDILYMFLPELPYGVEVNDAACTDVNNDELKDFVLIIEDDYYPEEIYRYAVVYLQREDGKFINDPELDNEINESGCNQDVDSVIKFLSE